MKLKIIVYFALILIGIGFLDGCKKNDNTVSAPTATQDPTATSDAATSLAGAMAINSGGVLDQVSDLLNTPTSTGLLSKSIASDPNFITSATYSYDSTSGWWTVNIDRTRSGALWYSHYTREYMHQFLNQNGQFQKYYINSGDTAYTVNHHIVGGTGVFNNLWLSHQLKSLSCEWVATGTNTSTVTINTTSPYIRSAIDTVTGALGGVRTLDHSITVNFINVKGPRGTGLDWYAKTSGTITGHYHALVTFTKGAAYSEHTIDRDFTITLGGTKVILVVGGTTFQADPNTGQIQ
ncbi:MAG: hypothetical protein P4L27_05155 [Ignavibacteriaceae bacterium]|nr:hypothetical protein [Ignavibacteriaceae bacterium]